MPKSEKSSARKTVESFARNRKETLKFLDYIVKHRPWLYTNAKIQRIADCWQHSVFQKVAGKKDAKLKRAQFCRYHYLCRSCANARSIKQIQMLRYYVEQHHLQRMEWYYVVLTIKHTKEDSLQDLMDKLFMYRAKLSKRRTNGLRASHKNKSVFSRFIGMVSVIEVTWTKSGGRHPHINIFGYMDEDDKLELIERTNFYWQVRKVNPEMETEREKLTGDSKIIYVRPVDSLWETYFDRRWTGEIFKYTLKLQDLPVEKRLEFIEYMEANKWRRFMVKHGTFEKMNKFCEWAELSPISKDDLEDTFYDIVIDKNGQVERAS